MNAPSTAPTPGRPLRVLIVEDNPADAELILRELRRSGYAPSWSRVDTEQEYLAGIEAKPQLIVSDYSMPRFDGLKAVKLLRERGLDIPFILVSGTLGEEAAVDAIKQGANDYLLKDRPVRLGPAIERALEEAKLREERRQMENSLRNAETRLRLATEASNIGAWEWNIATNEVYLSPEWKRQLGYADHELPNRLEEWENRLHPDDRERILKQVHAFMNDPALGYDVEFRLRHRDGSYRWIHTQAMLIHGAGDRALRMLGCHVDITESLQARRALQETEERYRALFDRSLDAVFVHDFEGRFVDANPAALQLLGYERADIGAQDFVTLLANEGDVARARSSLQLLLSSGKLEGMLQYELKRKDGALIWVELVSSLVFADGRPVAVQGIARDITERKRAEEQLRKLSRAVEQSPVSTVITDKAGRIEYVNPKFTKLTGYSLEEVDGLNPRLLKGGETSSETYRELWRTITAGDEWHGELHNRKKNGEYFWVKVSISPIHDSDGAITHFLSVNEDITERRYAEQKLREQAALLDKAQDAILVRNLQHQVTYWNHSAERIYGWKADEALGRLVTELIYRDTEQFVAATEATLNTGEWVGELVQYARTGQQLTVEARWTLVRDDQGQPQSILAINTDITEKKRIEELSLRSQRLESIGTLAGGIAHDLNNILAPILVSIDMLRDDVRDKESLSMLDTMQSCAKRGADLVRQVLSFARGIEGQRIDVDLGHLLRDIRQIIQETFPKNIKVATQIARDLRLVNGDPTQLHQVVMNFCVNARDAMPMGGSLTISAGNVEFDEMYAGVHPDARAGSYVSVSVTDSGTGIPPEIQDRIFEPFFTTKEVGKGTGLGLSTVVGIVRQHGGFTTLESEVGKGSTFKMLLPAAESARAHDHAAKDEKALLRGRGECVLVVDDEAPLREASQRTLQRFGYRVMLAAHGAEAVALYAAHREEISVVLTDMAMPIMDGLSTIIALKTIDPAVKIIASSGLSNHEEAVKALESRVSKVLHKPYTAERLLAVLADALGRAPGAPAELDRPG